MKPKNIRLKTTTKLLKVSVLVMLVGFASCERFFDPDQDIILKEDAFFKDWYDYRSAELGLYGLQQDLAEQMLILGELRADLLETNPHAGRDLIEVENFEISPSNKYASPRNFYRLIAACNNLQRTLEYYHPEVLDPDAEITNYDRLYGEVINMRAWAYFNAVRIYRSIPWIPVYLTTIDEITEFVNTPKSVVDSFDIIFHIDGYHNDTIWHDEPKVLENAYFELPEIVDSCTWQIENKIKATGVNHYINNNDRSWEITIWNDFAMRYLLGQMYLYKGDLNKAIYNFDFILEYIDIEATDVRYGLDETFQDRRWKNMFTSINRNEHIFVMWFGNSHRQTNEFQSLFSVVPPNKYELKPTTIAIHKWETIWDGWFYKDGIEDPAKQTLRPGYHGLPGDFNRGHRVSYAYILNEEPVSNTLIMEMLELKRDENDFEVYNLMEYFDTVVYKYTLGRENDPYSSDPNFIVARAASVHLYAAEIYSYLAWYPPDQFGDKSPRPARAEQYLNDGSYRGNGKQLGVRGRVGFADSDEKITIENIYQFFHDPFTNLITGYREWWADDQLKQEYLEDNILEERARELAYEGERFYDLVRVATKRGDPSYLADRVSAKFSGDKRELIREKLMDESNWYLPFFLGDED